jgi:hypothetical protein
MIVTQLQFGGDVLGDSAEVLSHALADRLHGLSRDGAVTWEISSSPVRSLNAVSTACSIRSLQSERRAAVTFISSDSNFKDVPRCKRCTKRVSSIKSFFNNPSISMPSSCCSFDHSWMSQNLDERHDEA